MAFSAATLPRAGWLRVVVFTFTAVTIFLWGYKLRFAVLSGAGTEPDPLLAGLNEFYAVTAFFGNCFR